MSKLQKIRVLVNERLTAAAEEIYALFERTIAEYEEELCRSQKENRRKQPLQDGDENPRVPLPGAGLGETEHMKKKPEGEKLPGCVPESSAVCVETEASSLLQLRQTQHGEQTQEEDISSEIYFYTETEENGEHFSDNDGNWKHPISPADAQMDTEPVGDHNNQEDHAKDRSTAAEISCQSSEYTSAPGTSAAANNGLALETDEGNEGTEHQCFVCKQQFENNWDLEAHASVHTGEELMGNLINQINDINERPYSCLHCPKTFRRKDSLHKHTRTHTGERPYGCRMCEKKFLRKDHLDKHIKIHTGEKPYCCSICEKTFARKDDLYKHKIIHSGEKPFSCLFCKKEFGRRDNLENHLKVHTGEKPFMCSVCNKCFSQSGGLKAHMETHAKKSKGKDKLTEG